MDFEPPDSVLTLGPSRGSAACSQVLRVAAAAVPFQEAAVKDDDEEVSVKGSESEDEETNRESQSERDDGSERDSEREQDGKQSRDDEAVSLLRGAEGRDCASGQLAVCCRFQSLAGFRRYQYGLDSYVTLVRIFLRVG